MAEVIDEDHRGADSVGEGSSEDVPVAEVDDGEEDRASLVPILELPPLVGVGGVGSADGFVAVCGAQFVEADGVDHVLAVTLELSSGEGIGVVVPVDVGQDSLCVPACCSSPLRPSDVDHVHEATSGGIGGGSWERAGDSAECLVAEGEGVDHESCRSQRPPPPLRGTSPKGGGLHASIRLGRRPRQRLGRRRRSTARAGTS